MKKQKPEFYRELLQKRRYDPNFEPPEKVPVFTIDGKVIGNNQNIVTFQAKMKQGKTTFFTAVMASALTRMQIFRIQVILPMDKKRIVYWDTEQSDTDFYKTLKRVKKLAQVTSFPANFFAYNMREDDPDIIIGCIGQDIADNPDTGLVIVDNATDLLNSFNNEEESKEKIQFLKKVSKQSDSLLIQAMHTGRGGENSLGHYGAFSDRASQSVLHVEKTDRGTITLKPKYLRSDQDFDPVELCYNSEKHNWEETFYIGESENVRAPKQTPADIEPMEHRARLSYLFAAEGIFLEYSKLTNGITELYAVPRQWARECVLYLIREKIIFKTEDGYTMNQQARLFMEQKK